ncbi:DUF4426 domain-containing protein [Sansalvadorimonas verongulae]|uniref:DUF4426 domain-containing protein n=1 Tax=Sansalvadorimonas verongulae TaxID=2172824 RepID=UPI0012BB648F|nr:DUF4426 domain-containing protein [Sansalvadorimonas verongulae]MTI14956.1 DUF4426 domain-containing protein [Sansalvadorimonas verongulae]
MKFLRLFLCASLALSPLLLSTAAKATEQLFGDYVVHYNAFNSTFLLPNVAKAYGIERSPTLGLINTSVLKNGKPVKADVVVESANLMAQKKNLNTWLVDEGDAMYYLSSFKFTHDELLHFTITVQPEGSQMKETVTFSQKFYKDE